MSINRATKIDIESSRSNTSSIYTSSTSKYIIVYQVMLKKATVCQLSRQGTSVYALISNSSLFLISNSSQITTVVIVYPIYASILLLAIVRTLLLYSMF